VNEAFKQNKKLPLLSAIALALIVTLSMWLFRADDALVDSPTGSKPVAPAKRQAPNPKFPTAKEVTGTSLSKRAFADYGLTTTSTEDDLKLVDGLIQNFYLSAKDQSNRFPMGTNREITRVLAGHNPMKRAWISAGHPAIDEGGELNDRWNTPLHFHPLARGVFEIRSAGPDREIYTDDDIVRAKPRVAEQLSPTTAGEAGTAPPEDI